jgi:HlyD family secretion protein
MQAIPFFRSHRTAVVVSLVVLSALGLWASMSNAQDSSKTTPAPKPALTVTTTQAQSAQLTSALMANGTVAAWQEAMVASQVQGLPIKELHANVGDWVQRGQLLATMDAEAVQADVALAQAALQEATAMAAEARANADRARSVQNGGVLSAQQVSQYLTQEQTAQAREGSAKAQWDAQQLRLKNTKVLAPDSGVISSRTASVGAVVGVGTEMFRMVRQARLEWRAEVTSHELGRISKGLPAVVTAPDGSRWQGRVRMVSPVVDAQTRNGVIYVDLVAANGAKNLHAALKPGMFAQGELQMGSSNALTVLQSAVVQRDGFSYVYRVGDDGRVAQRKVQTGRLQGERVEIVTGIDAEDKLVATGAAFLSDGDLVRVVPAPAK